MKAKRKQRSTEEKRRARLTIVRQKTGPMGRIKRQHVRLAREYQRQPSERNEVP